MVEPGPSCPQGGPTSGGLPALADDIADKPLTNEMLQVLISYLRKNGLPETEEALAREASHRLRPHEQATPLNTFSPIENVVGEFDHLMRQVDASIDVVQAEFSLLVYPIFAHSFIKLMTDSQPHIACDFFSKFHRRIPSVYEEQVAELGRLTTPQQMNASNIVQMLKNKPFMVKMSRSCMKQLDHLLNAAPVIKSLLKDSVAIEQSDLIYKVRSSVECQMGGSLGQVGRHLQRHKMLYGVHRDEVWQIIEKKKNRGKEVKDQKKNQAAAPVPDRVPLPQLSEAYREERIRAAKDASKMTLVSAESPPSVCMFTVLNAMGGVTSCDLTDDSAVIAVGYGDSTIGLFALDESQKLKRLNDADQLEKIDLQSDYEELPSLMYDESGASNHVQLLGHGGPVYSVNFSPDKRLLLSSSKDKTIRLWSTDTHKNVVVHRMSLPVWQVQFSQRGYYFCSGGADRCVALWCTEKMHPLRLFTDSFGHVGCVDFHPNCNYIVGGSDDRYVRIWDVLSGACVRTFGGHKSAVRAVKTSPCGRYVVSVGGDGSVCVWDVAYHRLLAMETRSVQATVGSITFSRDGGSFAVSHGGPNVSIYSLDNLIASQSPIVNEANFDPKVNPSNFNLYSYPTKQSPVVGLQFTRRNLLLAVGSFGQ